MYLTFHVWMCWKKRTAVDANKEARDRADFREREAAEELRSQTNSGLVLAAAATEMVARSFWG